MPSAIDDSSDRDRGDAAAESAPGAVLTLRTLGALSLRAGDRELLVGRRRELVLLAYVARQAPRPVSRRTLGALLWGDRSEERARHSLRQTILRLRPAVGEALRVQQNAVAVNPEAIQLDLVALERELREQHLAEAVALCRGEFLPHTEDIGCDEFRAWLEAEREGVRSRIAWALEQLVTGAERVGDWQTATRWAERWVELRPDDERPHVRLVHLLPLTGRVDDALARHAAFLVRLRDELGMTPSPGLEQVSIALQHVRDAARARDPAVSRWPLTPDLVGRGGVLASLLGAWEQVKSGGNAVVLVIGDEGLGKTRLCQELLRWLAAHGEPALPLTARGLGAASDVPWSTAAELLGPLAEAPGLFAASPRALGELARLVPTLQSRVRNLPESAGGDHELIEATAEVLREVSAEVPVLLFVDDLARSDESSRRLVLALVRRRTRCRVLFLFTAAPDDAHSDGPLAGLRDDTVRRIRLEPLSPAEVDALLAGAVNLPAGERRLFGERLAEESGGNPLFLVELLAALAEDGRLVSSPSGGWHISPSWSARPLPEPASIRSVVERRIEQLDDDARALIATAAVYGKPFDIELAESLTGLPRVTLYVALNDLIARRLVRESVVPPVHYTLAHDLVRRIAYASIPTERRQELLRAAAEATSPRTERRSGAEPAIRDHAPSLATPVSVTTAPGVPWARQAFAGGARSWLRLAVGAGAMIAAAVMLAGVIREVRAHLRAETPRATVIAVGHVEDFATSTVAAADGRGTPRAGSDGGDLSSSGPAVAAMLATDLARVPGLRVVSSGRMYELLASQGMRGPAATSGAFERAARDAGAAQMLEGSLFRHRDGTLRLDLRRVDLTSGAVLSAHAVEDRDPFALVDRATAEVARVAASATVDGRARDTLGIADVTTSSFAAYRLYERGLRAYYGLAPGSPGELFAAALQEDSSFAMAAFYFARSSNTIRPDYYELLVRSARLAEHASDRERLLIRSVVAFELDEPVRLVLADSFVARYPGDPEGLVLRGRARIWDGDWRGLADLRQVATSATQAFHPGAVCLACEAMTELIAGYWLADSLPEAERTAREWMRRAPSRADAMGRLVPVLAYGGRIDEAIALLRQVDSMNVAEGRADVRAVAWPRALFEAQFSIRAHRFAAADRLLDSVRRAGPWDARSEALWLMTVSLRAQGRLRAARSAAAAMEQLWRSASSTPEAPPLDPLLARAQILFEMGHPREAAVLFQSLVGLARPEPYLRAWAARHRAWMLTHAATARAAAGDTSLLPALADSIERLGTRSAYGRDRRLHHHVRALLLLARGDTTDAAMELRRAIFSPTGGYTRSNLELGRALLALHRPGEAVTVARAALRGALDASNYYVTRTDLEELLADAFDAAGQGDSAAAYYRVVVTAWRAADPSLASRVEHARRRLARVQSGSVAGIPGHASCWMLTSYRSPARPPAGKVTVSSADTLRVRPGGNGSSERPLGVHSTTYGSSARTDVAPLRRRAALAIHSASSAGKYLLARVDRLSAQR